MISLLYMCAESLPAALNTHIRMEICSHPEDLCLLSESVHCCNKSKQLLWKCFPVDGSEPNWTLIVARAVNFTMTESGDFWVCKQDEVIKCRTWKSALEIKVDLYLMCFIFCHIEHFDAICTWSWTVHAPQAFFKMSPVSLLSDQHVHTKNLLYSLMFCATH